MNADAKIDLQKVSEKRKFSMKNKEGMDLKTAQTKTSSQKMHSKKQKPKTEELIENES